MSTTEDKTSLDKTDLYLLMESYKSMVEGQTTLMLQHAKIIEKLEETTQFSKIVRESQTMHDHNMEISEGKIIKKVDDNTNILALKVDAYNLTNSEKISQSEKCIRVDLMKYREEKSKEFNMTCQHLLKLRNTFIGFLGTMVLGLISLIITLIHYWPR